jgi:two-component system, chemotaxis family, chemotaxis protein CheY
MGSTQSLRVASETDQPDSRRILVVDDDSGIRLLLVTFLRCHGFRVLQASNGSEALERMRGGNADLVVMDLMMPQVSGWDVLAERSRDPFLRRIPVIVATAANRTEVLANVAGQCVWAVLGKPFDLDALLECVTTGLEPQGLPAPLAA